MRGHQRKNNTSQPKLHESQQRKVQNWVGDIRNMVAKPSTMDIPDTSIECHRKFSKRIRIECKIDTIAINEKKE
jgi:hypothetical protein